MTGMMTVFIAAFFGGVLMTGIVKAEISEATFPELMLEAHNELRALHQDTGALVWDPTLASAAQTWAEHMATIEGLQHDGARSPPGECVGENIAFFSSGDNQKAVINWYSEYEEYDFNHPSYSSATGHFTQVVWGQSEKLGCGFKTGAYGKYAPVNYVVCRYAKCGNYNNQFADNVKPFVSGADVAAVVAELEA